MKRKIFYILLLAYMFVFSLPAFSTTINDISPEDFKYYGDASGNGVEGILTSETGGRAGAFWYQKKIDLNDKFTYKFAVNLGNKGYEDVGIENDDDWKTPSGEEELRLKDGYVDRGADGIAFILQNSGNNVLGNTGSSLGYGGIKSSFAVEFDTYNNNGYYRNGDLTYDRGDLDNGIPKNITYDHMAFLNNGYTRHDQSYLGDLAQKMISLGDIEDGRYHEVKFEWDPSVPEFKAYFDDMTTPKLILKKDIRGADFLGSNQAYFGFTGSTGNERNKQMVKSISFQARVVDMDFGDAPESYITSLSSHNSKADGPHHIIKDGIFLGRAISADKDGKPSSDGLSDSYDDGVSFPHVTGNPNKKYLIAGKTNNLVVNASKDGYLSSWIDYDGNGHFDPSEKSSFLVKRGDNNIPIKVPDWAKEGRAFARFRYSTDSNEILNPTGLAKDGEVEDYPIEITKENIIFSKTIQDLGVVATGVGASDGFAEQGETIQYTLTIENKDDYPVYDLNIKDDINLIVNQAGHGDLTHRSLYNFFDGTIKDIKVEDEISQGNSTTLSPSGDLVNGLIIDKIDPNHIIKITFKALMKGNYPLYTISREEVKNTASLETGKDQKNICYAYKNIPIKEADSKDFSIVKEVSDANGDGVAEDEELLTYSIKVGNNSGIIMENVIVGDTLSSRFLNENNIKAIRLTKLDGTPEPFDGGIISGINIHRLMPGQEKILEFDIENKYPVDYAKGELILNKAFVKYGAIIKNSTEVTIPTEKVDVSNLSITKSVEDRELGKKGIVAHGEELTYTIDVMNNSNIDLANVRLSDELKQEFFGTTKPSEFKITPIDINGTTTGSTETKSEDIEKGILFTQITSKNGFRVEFKISADYSSTLMPGAEIVNIAKVHYDGHEKPSNEAKLPIETPNVDSSLEITKSVEDTELGKKGIVAHGEELTYTIDVMNNSNIDLANVRLSDELKQEFFGTTKPSEFKITPIDINGTTTGSTETKSEDIEKGILFTQITSKNGFRVEFKINADYSSTLMPGAEIVNIAKVHYDGHEKPSNEAKLPIQKFTAIDLDIKLQVEDLGGDGFEKGDGIVDDGEEAEYTISITNPTPLNALNVLVSDDYKGLYLYKNDSYKYVSFDGGKLSGKDLKEGVILPEIKAGETIKLKFMVGFSYEGKDVDQDDTIPNEAYLSLQETSPLKKLRRAIAPINKSSNKVVLNVAKPTYTLSKEIRNKKDEFYPGDVVVYDITLENTSKVIGKNIKIEDKVSEIKAFESWTWESGISKTPESLLKTGLRKDLSENGIELLAGEIKRYTVVGRLKDNLSKGEVKNTVEAGENLELQAEATLKVVDAQIKVTKTAKKKWVSIGDLISYKITVQNLSGNKGTVLKNLSLKDMMPPGFKYAEGSGKVDGNDADEDLRGRTIYFNNLELIGDKKIEITYILRIGTGVKPGSYKNKAWIENASGKNLSNIGEASVEVINDPLFNSTVIIGKVFHDRDNDGWQDDANAYDIRVETLSFQDNYLDGSVKKGDEEWRISSESKELLLGNLGGRGDESEKSQKVILRRRIKDPKKIGDILIKSKEGSNITLKSTGEILRNHSGNRNLTGVDLKVVRRVIKDPKYREELKNVKSLKKVRIENFIEPIYFDSAYANIRDGENEKLKQYLEKLSNKKNLKLVIVGYTDSQKPSKKATFKNNHELSIARANTLKDYLSMKLDLSEEMFVIEGKGPKNPKGSNRTSSGRQLNRRTEIVIEYDEEIMKQIPLKVDESDYFEEVEIRNDGISEEGIPGVRLATVEGLVIETDQFGRYHVDGIDDIPDRGKNFIIKVDKVTLPSGTEFTTENPRVKTLTKVMEKFNFGVKIPKVKRRVKEKEIKVRVGSVFFLTDKWNVREDQIDNLKKISSLLTEYRGGVIVVEGNTDSRASNKYNEILALKRAKSIGKELEKIMGKDMISNVKIVTDLSGGER